MNLIIKTDTRGERVLKLPITVFLLSKKMLTIVFFRDGTKENSVIIFPCPVIRDFFGAADRIKVKESFFVTMKYC